MVMPTTKVQTPGKLIINNGTKDLTYEIAEALVTRGGVRQLVRQWRIEKRQIQQGQGELIKHWDSWHSGMGWSRDETRDALYALPVYSSGPAVTTHRGFLYPRFAITALSLTSAASIHRIAEMGGYIYIFSRITGGDIRVHKYNPSTGAVVNEKTMTGWTGLAGQCAEFGGYLYVPSTNGEQVFKELTTIASGTSDDTWTSGPATRIAYHLGVAGNLLWRVGDSAAKAKSFVVNSCAAVSSGGSGGPLTAANWSDTADYVIGKPGRNINSIAELGRWPYFGKEEGLFGADSEGNQTNALDFTRNLIAATNCSDMIRWLGTLVICHKTGLWQHTGVSSGLIGVETLEGNLGSIKGGRYTALAAAGQWLYVAYLLPSGSTAILAGRPGGDEERDVVWHHLQTVAGTVNAMFVSGLLTNPRLYFTYDGTTHDCYYMILAQDGSPDPSDANVSFAAAADNNCDLPGVDWGMPGTPKRGHMVEVVTSQATGTGGTVTVYYGWEGATPSTQLGATITTAGKVQRFWTAGTTDSGYRPQIRIGVTGHASNNLRVEKVSLYCIPLPRKEPIITTVVRCGDNLDKLRNAKTMYDDLEALENAGVYTVRDPDDPVSGTFKVVVENIDEIKGEQLADYSGERLLSVTMRIVEYA